MQNPSQPILTHPKYRADIDGLRAIAVLAVVVFHAFPGKLPGGFVGVDIFFVISGFLISTIIFDNLNNETFEFHVFYVRRIRRIFPALIVVLLATCYFGSIVLLPDEYKQLSKHMLAGAGFVANFALWRESGYFDESQITKPLMHLWSLGVEEQFYILWPFILWIFWKRKANLFVVTLAIFLVSFFMCLNEIRTDAVAAFYMPQTRFWELLVGGLLSWICREGECRKVMKALFGSSFSFAENIFIEKDLVVRNILSLAGFVLLGGGFIWINKDLSHLGAWDLIPVLGAAFVIFSGQNAWINRNILSGKILVWFGLISFPLYLWHWPLLSFAYIVEGEVPDRRIRLAAILAAIALSYVTYRFVEKPIRSEKILKDKTGSIVIAMIVVAAIGGAVYFRNGIVRYDALTTASVRLTDYSYFNGQSEDEFWSSGCFNITQDVSFFKRNRCDSDEFKGAKRVFLIGDSHSAYLSQYLRIYLRTRSVNLHQFSSAYCTPLSLLDQRPRCRALNSYVFSRISEEKPDTIVLFANYLLWGNSPDYGEPVPFDEFIKNKVNELSRSGISKVIVIGQIPTWEDTLPHVLLKRFVRDGKDIPVRTYNGVVPESLVWDSKLAKQKYSNHVSYLSLKNFLCDANGCLTRVGTGINKDLIVFDYGHLTKSGAEYITKLLVANYLE